MTQTVSAMSRHKKAIWRVGSIAVRVILFVFQAEDVIRGLVRSRGLGDLYKRQAEGGPSLLAGDRYRQGNEGDPDDDADQPADDVCARVRVHSATPVSYTHLTLPTIYPV